MPEGTPANKVLRESLMDKLNPWDTDCEATKVGLERFIRALLCVQGHFTSSFTIGNYPLNVPSRGVSVFFRVHIPDGREREFEELSGMTLAAPPKIVLN